MNNSRFSGLMKKESLRERVQADRKRYADNIEMIHADRSRTMRMIIFAGMLVIGILSLAGFFVPIYKQPQPCFIGGFVSMAALALAYSHFRSPTAVLIESYFLEAILLTMTTFIGNEMGPQAYDVSFIAMFCLVPITLIDRIPRKTLMSLLFLGVHVMLSVGHKDPRVLTITTLICCVIITGSTLVSYSVQRAKIMCYDLLRESDYAKRHDFLTGLCNRLQLGELIDGEGVYSDKKATSVYILDIDCYKGFNDTYGHIAGDECLKKMGEALIGYGEENGLEFFRYGGEEILAVGFETGEDIEANAGRFAQEILECVRALGIPYEAAPTGVVTVSVGYTTEQTDLGRMIDLADRAMYQAKAAGRNCVRKYIPE